MFRHSASAASPSLAVSSAHDWDSSLSSSLPPSKQQLAALIAVPAGLILQSKSKGGSKAKKKKGKGGLAKDGQIISKIFDSYGSRPTPNNGLNLFQTVQMEFEGVITRDWNISSSTAGLPAYSSAYFSVNGFPGTGTLLSVFDQYRIDQVEAWVEFQAPNGTLAFPDLITAVDLDDANTPTSVGQIQDHQGALVAAGPGGHYHKFRPHMAVAAFSGAFTSYSNQPSDWIDAASPAVQHYGLKGATISNGGSFSVNLVSRIVVSFRSPAIN